MSSGRSAELAYLHDLGVHAGIDASGIDPPVAHRIDLDGLRFRYLEWGDRHASPIVLLHGGGQSARTWDACCLMLARRYRCLALDQRGHGDTQWSAAGAYSIADHVRDIAAFVDRLELTDTIIVGMSMGGINATAYAVERADHLRALVCIDVGPDVQLEPVQRLMREMAAHRRFASPQDAAQRLSKLGARRDASLLVRTLARNMRQDADGSWTWKFDPRPLVGLTAEELLAPRKPLWNVLARITCPVLVVRGADSDIFSPADAQKLRSGLANAKLVTVPRARHSVQTDNPHGLAQAIMAFDDDLPPRRTARSGSR